MNTQSPVTRRIAPQDVEDRQLLGKVNFALLLCSLWLGMTAASAAILMSLSDGAPTAVTAERVTDQPATRTIADGNYRTWDDVATAPLPGQDNAGDQRAPDSASGNRDTVRGKANKQQSRKQRDAKKQRGKWDQFKHDPKSVVDL